MISQHQREFMELLLEWAKEAWPDPSLVENDDLLMLRFEPTLLSEDDGKVLIEVCLLEYSDDMDVAQIYVTLLPEPLSGSSPIRKKLNMWNFNSIAGSYGVYEAQNLLYLKHNVAIPVAYSTEIRVDMAFTGIALVTDEAARYLPEILS